MKLAYFDALFCNQCVLLKHVPLSCVHSTTKLPIFEKSGDNTVYVEDQFVISILFYSLLFYAHKNGHMCQIT